MTTPRRSTPRRARSSSVTSNTSATSNNTPATTSARKTKKAKESKQKKEAKEAAAAAAAADEDALVRPALPTRMNPVLPDKAPEVKLQIIRRENKEIVIGRVKLPTVNHDSDHAFLLRRFDTDAMAASSMFRVAFPYANAADERVEMDYLEKRFDFVSANGGPVDKEKLAHSEAGKKKIKVTEDGLPVGSTGVKLQGTWIPSQDALKLAEEYGLYPYALPLVEAKYVMENGEAVPQLASSTSSSKSTPRVGKRQKVVEGSESTPTSIASTTTATTLNGSPALVNTKTTKSTKPNGAEEIVVEKTQTSIVTNGTALTPEEIEAQIKASKNLVNDVKSSKASSSRIATPSRKRRALNDAPTAESTDPLDEDEEEFEGNSVIRTFRRGTRVARRRPLATSAGTLGAGMAVGAASLAYMAGGNLDVALQILQSGATQVGSWFF